MARTFPTGGMSPIDVYLNPHYKSNEVGRAGGYFELAPTGEDAASGCSLYSKVTLLGTIRTIKGRTSVIEGRLEVGAGAVRQGSMSVLCLDWSFLNTDSLNNIVNAYVILRDRTHATVGQIRSFLHFQDHATLPDGGATLGAGVLSDSGTTDPACNVRVTCSYGPGNTRFWLLGTTTAPD